MATFLNATITIDLSEFLTLTRPAGSQNISILHIEVRPAIFMTCYKALTVTFLFSRMFTLSCLGDVTKYLDGDFKCEVFLITEDETIRCSGIMLAARSTVIEEIIQISENIPAIEFSDNLPGLFVCLNLIYGGSVEINEENYRSIFKFGKIFQIKEMMDAVLKWVAEDIPYHIFWDVYFELTKLDPNVSTAAFQDSIKRYFSKNYDGFIKSIFQICHDGEVENFRRVMELVVTTNEITSDKMLTFFIHLLNTDKDDDVSITPPSKSAIQVDVIISNGMDYIEKVDVDILSKKCMETLGTFSSVCNNVDNLRKIAGIQHDIIHFKEPIVCSVNDLSRMLIRILTSPSTSNDTIKYFTEHAGGELHPCITAEIVLKWWRVREGVCPDNTFIKTLLSKVQEMYSEWVTDVISDSRYVDIVSTFGLGNPAVSRNLYYNSDIDRVSQLKQCIQARDGTPLVLPVEDIVCTDNMSVYKDTVPAFRYNPAVVPPYTINNGHWYLVCKYKDNDVTAWNFISFITDTQQDIINYLETCVHAFLCFVPIPDSDSQGDT